MLHTLTILFSATHAVLCARSNETWYSSLSQGVGIDPDVATVGGDAVTCLDLDSASGNDQLVHIVLLDFPAVKTVRLPSGCGELDRVVIEETGLERIDLRPLEGSIKLTELWLQDNNLRVLDTSPLVNATTLESVSLYGNPYLEILDLTALCEADILPMVVVDEGVEVCARNCQKEINVNEASNGAFEMETRTLAACSGPTETPTSEPTFSPTGEPTQNPSAAPTWNPTSEGEVGVNNKTTNVPTRSPVTNLGAGAPTDADESVMDRLMKNKVVFGIIVGGLALMVLICLNACVCGKHKCRRKKEDTEFDGDKKKRTTATTNDSSGNWPGHANENYGGRWIGSQKNLEGFETTEPVSPSSPPDSPDMNML